MLQTPAGAELVTCVCAQHRAMGDTTKAKCVGELRQLPTPGGELGLLPATARWFGAGSWCVLPWGGVLAGRAGMAATG